MIIKRNSARCLKCDVEVESKHQHDFKRCPCGAIAVDGGSAYLRRVGDLDAYKDTSVTEVDESRRLKNLLEVEMATRGEDIDDIVASSCLPDDLDQEVDENYPSIGLFTAWTNEFVYWSCYHEGVFFDIGSAPRNPCKQLASDEKRVYDLKRSP